MHIIGIIPARYGSSRYPGKPLAHILGKPMIQHVYERARRADRLDRLMTRAEHPSGTDRLSEACDLLGLAEEDVIVNIQGDEPALEAIMIDLLIEALEKSPYAPMATLVFKSRKEEDYLDHNVVKVVADEHARALYFSRSPIPYRREASGEPLSFLKHLGFYAYRHDFLRTFTGLPPGRLENLEKLEQLRALEHGYPIQIAFSPMDSHGVDTPEDLERLSSLWECQTGPDASR
jgi:3-deoxy-manno-octulosonate cytidylyltransferase (CMP-KDO synthetase)